MPNLSDSLSYKLLWYRAKLNRPYLWAKGEHQMVENLLLTDGERYGEVTFPPSFNISDSLFEECLAFLRDFSERAAVCHPSNIQARDEAAWVDGSSRLLTSRSRRFQWLASSLALASIDSQHELPPIPINGFCDNLSDLSNVVRDNLAQGIETIKVKLAGVDDLKRFCSVLTQIDNDQVRFRLDPNGSLGANDLIAAWQGNAELRRRTSYFEEPCSLEECRSLKGSGVPIAFDHFGGNIERLIADFSDLNVKAVIIKPAEYGNLEEIRRAVELIISATWQAVITSSLESPLGIYGCWRLAQLVGNHGVANGLSLYNYWHPDDQDGVNNSQDLASRQAISAEGDVRPNLVDGKIALWDYPSLRRGVLSQIDILKQATV